MNADEVEIKIIAAADRDSVRKLYRQAGWWQESDQTPDGNAWIDALVKGSFCFVGAFAGSEMVGMGRAVSDGVSDAYIQDVVVLKEYRGQGIGRELVRRLTQFCVSRGISWIGLVAEPGTQRIYEELGFGSLAGYQPMLFGKR